jgi:predicted transcriptional regulator
MPTVSNKKIEKISEQILHYLYGIFPKQVFTSGIAEELARDEEFIKKILLDLEKKGLVVKINQNSEGIKYSRRLRWRISNKSYELYKKMQ